MEVVKYIMEYKIEDKSKNLRILGDIFVENNKNKGVLVINNKKFPLISIISINDLKKNKIQIILSKNFNNRAGMFKNCESLESLSQIIDDNKIIEEDLESNECINENNNNFSKNTTDNIEDSDRSGIFNMSNESTFLENNFSTIENPTQIESLTFTSDFLDLKFNAYTDMSYMFYNCVSLKALSDISEYINNSVINIIICFLIVNHYNIYRIYLNGILKKLMI